MGFRLFAPSLCTKNHDFKLSLIPYQEGYLDNSHIWKDLLMPDAEVREWPLLLDIGVNIETKEKKRTTEYDYL